MIDIPGYKTDYLVIENLAQYFRAQVPNLPSDDPRAVKFWSIETAKAIEGIWGKETTGYRFMPGNLYFYGKYGRIQDTDINKVTKIIVPKITDIIWEICYYMHTCKGFSGFIDDDEWTSDYRYFAFKEKAPDLSEFDPSNPEDKIVLDSILALYNQKGELKKFIDPLENLRRTHDKPKGRMMYYNTTKNGLIFGTRGGGKSYYFAIAEYAYTLLFDGAKSYVDFKKKTGKSEVCIGSSVVDKSSEFCQKIEDFFDLFLTDKGLGAFGSPGDVNYTPAFWYRQFNGSIKVNNKKNPYRYEYEVLENGITSVKGTKTALFHVNYAPNKRDSETAGAGGRYNIVGYEEMGLNPNAILAWNSNDSTVSRNGIYFGVQVGFGTSGNIENVRDSKKMFLNPADYNILSIKDKWEGNGQNGNIGFFIPYYMTVMKYKDKNGNTDYTQAIREVLEQEAEKAASGDPKVLRDHKMNKPNKPSDMWTTNKIYLLPRDEAVEREKQLLKGNLYKSLMLPVKLTWDPINHGKVIYNVDFSLKPITDFPLNFKENLNMDGAVVLYEEPTPINGYIPPDMYKFVGHDPYIAEELDKGGSIGTTYVLKNPKYIQNGLTGNILVATYHAKPLGGLEEYYSNQEKLLALYGNPPEGLWYEADKGDKCRAYYIKKNKLNLLALAPQRETGRSLHQQNIVRTGYLVGNKAGKLNLIQTLNDWLLEETTLFNPQTNQPETLKNIFRIPCIFTVRQIALYTLEDNFDGIMGLCGSVLGLREYQNFEQARAAKKSKMQKNPLSFITSNPNIFKQSENRHKLYKPNTNEKVYHRQQSELDY
jgi:hypothetical protein